MDSLLEKLTVPGPDPMAQIIRERRVAGLHKAHARIRGAMFLVVDRTLQERLAKVAGRPVRRTELLDIVEKVATGEYRLVCNSNGHLPPSEPLEELRTVRQAADCLGVDASTIYAWISAGRLKAVRTRGMITMIPLREIERVNQ